MNNDISYGLTRTRPDSSFVFILNYYFLSYEKERNVKIIQSMPFGKNFVAEVVAVTPEASK